ncbi:MAG: FHA domain-containing protein [Myxococcota bacterium]
MGAVWTFLGSNGSGNEDLTLFDAVSVVEGFIGSDASCENHLSDPLLMKRHAQLIHRDGDWYLGGVAIASPTFINGVATPFGEAKRLIEGDLVRMGDSYFRVGGAPPLRGGIDLSDETALARWADEAGEAGDPLAAAWLDREPIEEVLALGDGVRILESTQRLPRVCEVRGGEEEVAALCLSPAARFIEELEVHVSADGRSELMVLRMVLHAIARAPLPRLETLTFGWLHDDGPMGVVARDFEALRRFLGLRNSFEESFRRAGQPRIVMLRSSEGWPPAGSVEPLTEDSTFGERLFFLSRRSGVRVSPPGHRHIIHRATPLVHGDVVEFEEVEFRFEED